MAQTHGHLLVLFLAMAFVTSVFAGMCPGVCQYTSTSCSSGYMSGLCPGGSNVECCPESTPNCPGQCQDNSLPCNGTYVSGECPGGNNIECCDYSAGGGGAGEQCICKEDMCTNVPANNQYYLTSFCDPSVACGDPMDCDDFYCADYMRFGCGNTVTCCCNGNGKCNNLLVIDGGPACYVEEDAGRPVVDASYSMCSTCTGSPSCGWSDHVSVTCTVSNREVDPLVYPRGPCSYDSGVEIGKCAGEFTSEMQAIFQAHR